MSEAKTILLVDDDKEFVESTRDVLETAGYRVIAAHDGAKGLALARKAKPNLMLLDVMMATDTEGFEISRKVPETPELKTMPVLLLTGIRKAMRLPFGFEPDETWLPVKGVLEKPVAPETLLEEVRKALG